MRADRGNLAIVAVFLTLVVSFLGVVTPAGGESPSPGWTDRDSDLVVNYGEVYSWDNQSINMNFSTAVIITARISNAC